MWLRQQYEYEYDDDDDDDGAHCHLAACLAGSAPTATKVDMRLMSDGW